MGRQAATPLPPSPAQYRAPPGALGANEKPVGFLSLSAVWLVGETHDVGMVLQNPLKFNVWSRRNIINTLCTANTHSERSALLALRCPRRYYWGNYGSC